MDFKLVQKIVHKQSGQEFDLGYLSEFTFIETMDLSGPKVIMRMRDPYLYLQDNLQVKADDEITITLADVFATEEMDSVMDFTILSVPSAQEDNVINALSSPVMETKRPATRARLFPVGSAQNMLSSFFPGVKQELTKLPVTESYHVLSGERPSLALKQLAREQGGHIYFVRDKVTVSRVEELMKKDADFTYHGGDNKEQYQVITYQVKKPEHTLKDRLVRSNQAFSITDGWVTANKNTDAVPRLVSSASTPVMDGMNAAPSPVIDCTVTGNGGVKAGSVIAFNWHTNRMDAPLNEALPEKVVVWAVAHHYSNNGYFCRIKGVVSL